MGDGTFKFNDELDLRLPLLVLAVKCPPEWGSKSLEGSPRYQFKPGREFINLQHQTSGHACNQVYMQATLLKPREPVKIQMLSDAWLDSDAGCFGVPLDEVLKYREQLKALFGLGVDCNHSYQDFEEGIYPIDCSPEAIKALCEDDLPEELDDLIEFGDNNFARLCVYIRWSLFVLGENCD
jgi:hypothetical protein